MIAEKPVMGFGPDNLKSEYTAREVTLDRAHNEILERAVSTGIPSAVFYVAAILLAITETFRKRNFSIGDGASLAPLMSVTTYFLSGLVGVFLFYTAGHLFIMLALVLLALQLFLQFFYYLQLFPLLLLVLF
jgi:O-antigen ligase